MTVSLCIADHRLDKCIESGTFGKSVSACASVPESTWTRIRAPNGPEPDARTGVCVRPLIWVFLSRLFCVFWNTSTENIRTGKPTLKHPFVHCRLEAETQKIWVK